MGKLNFPLVRNWGECLNLRLMPFEMLFSRLPEIAKTETRTVFVPPNSQQRLPSAEYSFVEMFCNEPGCDCRRVFFTVFSSRTKAPEALIAYGWETANFYKKWFKYGGFTKKDIAELMGPVLNMGSPQTARAPGILELFSEVLLPDHNFIERVKHHYQLFRATVDHPPEAAPHRGMSGRSQRRKNYF